MSFKIYKSLLDINECLTLPCSNGGICADEYIGYSCNCTEQWLGQNCRGQFFTILFSKLITEIKFRIIVTELSFSW